MSSKLNSKERNVIFRDICNLLCPKYLSRQSKPAISTIAHALTKLYDVNMRNLYSQAEKFISKYPNTRFIDEEIPSRPAGGCGNIHTDYRKAASRIMKKYIGIKIPITSSVSATFYEAVLKHNLVSRKEQPLLCRLNPNDPFL